MSDHDRKYWQYEYDVAAGFIVPLLDSWGVRAAGADVLDVGCGAGRHSFEAYRRGADVIAFDQDAEGLADVDTIVKTTSRSARSRGR